MYALNLAYATYQTSILKRLGKHALSPPPQHSHLPTEHHPNMSLNGSWPLPLLHIIEESTCPVGTCRSGTLQSGQQRGLSGQIGSVFDFSHLQQWVYPAIKATALINKTSISSNLQQFTNLLQTLGLGGNKRTYRMLDLGTLRSSANVPKM